MGHKSRGNYPVGICLGCCECPKCRKKRESQEELNALQKYRRPNKVAEEKPTKTPQILSENEEQNVG